MSHHLRKFISFEGGEGSGKTTQISLLIARLEQQFGAAQILKTREPGGTEFSDKIRSILVEASEEHLTAHTQSLLLYAARAEHLTQKIRPALAEGKWVVSDRFSDSTFAYQGHALGLDFGFLNMLEAEIVGKDKPTLTIFLDIDPEVGLSRAFSRHDNETKYESLGLAFHQKLHAGFHQMIASEPARFCVIDATQSIEAIHEKIWAAVVDKFGLEGAK